MRGYYWRQIDTFVLTNIEGEIKKDKELLQRMSTKIKRKLSDIDITFKKIHIEGQYGETNY